MIWFLTLVWEIYTKFWVAFLAAQHFDEFHHCDNAIKCSVGDAHCNQSIGLCCVCICCVWFCSLRVDSIWTEMLVFGYSFCTLHCELKLCVSLLKPKSWSKVNTRACTSLVFWHVSQLISPTLKCQINSHIWDFFLQTLKSQIPAEGISRIQTPSWLK